MKTLLFLLLLFIQTALANEHHYDISADNYAEPALEINKILNEHYLTQPHSTKIIISLCGEFSISESILLGSNTELIGCESGATLKLNTAKPILSKGYEKALIKLNKSFEKNSVKTITYHDIKVSNLILDGMADTLDEKEIIDNSAMGIVFTSVGLNNTTKFTIKNIDISGNHITNFVSNGIIVGNPNEQYFNGNFNFIDISITNNIVDNLKRAGAAIHVVDETIPELTYSELGYLANYRLDRVTIQDNIVHDSYTDHNNRLHGSGFGIIVDAAKHVKVLNNQVGNFAEEGIRIYDSNFVLIDNNTVLPSYPLVVGNAFNANGIKLNRVANAIISNNNITNTSGPAIELYGTAKVSVIANKANQDTSHGLRIENYLVLDNLLCQGENVDMDICLFRNRYVDIINNDISHQCGCAITFQSEVQYFDRIEFSMPDAKVNYCELSTQEQIELTDCNTCN